MKPLLYGLSGPDGLSLCMLGLLLKGVDGKDPSAVLWI